MADEIDDVGIHSSQIGSGATQLRINEDACDEDLEMVEIFGDLEGGGRGVIGGDFSSMMYVITCLVLGGL